MTRDLKLKIAIDGETEFKKSIANINREYKVLESELKLIESDFRGNANSMAALSAKGETLSKMLDTQKAKVSEAEKALKLCKQAYEDHGQKAAESAEKIAKLKKELEDLEKSGKATKEELEELKKSIKLAETEQNTHIQIQEKAETSAKNWQKSLNNAKIAVNNLTAEQEKNNGYMQEAADSADGCAKSIDGYGKEVEQATDDTDSFNKKVDALAQTLIAAGLTRAFGETVSAIKECSEASKEFESAFTGVLKTVDGTPEQLNAISDEIKKLSTEIPASTTEIAKVAELGGQLGIATDDVMKFTKTIIDLSESTDLAAENGATMIAQFANITGLHSEDYEKFGSVLVELGNNSATTESKIMELSHRIGATGKVVGMTQAEIAGISTALASVGIEAEAGGTAVSRVLQAVESYVQSGSGALDDYAAVAGMSADEFAKAWGQNAAGAFAKFIDGIATAEERGTSAVKILDDLEIKNQRQRDVLLRLGNAQKTTAEYIEMANGAWRENTALAEEAGKRYATTESRAKMAENAFRNFCAAIGDELNPALAKLNDAGADLAEWSTEIIQKYPWLVDAITAVTIGITGVCASFAALNAVLKITELLAAALSGTTIVGLRVAAAALTAAVYAYISSQKESNDQTEITTKKTNELTSAINESKQAFDQETQSIEEQKKETEFLTDALFDLAEKEDKTAAEKTAMKNIIDQLNDVLPELKDNFDAETGAINLTREAVEKLTEAKFKQIQMSANEQRLTELYKQQNEGKYQEKVQQEAVDSAKNQLVLNVLKNKYGKEWDSFDEDVQTQLRARLLEQEPKIFENLNAKQWLNFSGIKSFDANRVYKGQKALYDLKTANKAIDEQIEYLKKQINDTVYGQKTAEPDNNGSNNNGVSGTSAAKTTSNKTTSKKSSSSSVAAKNKPKTQAEINLESYKNVVKELDFLRNMDVLNDEQYYRQKGAAADKYLTAEEENIDEYKSWLVERHKYETQLDEVAQKEREKRREEEQKATKAFLNQYVENYKNSINQTIDYYKNAANEIKSQIEEIQREQEALKQKLASYGDLFTEKNGVYKVESSSQLDAEIKKLQKWDKTMAALKERGLPSYMLGKILSMDVDDAIGYGRSILNKNDKEFDKFIEKLGEKQAIADDISAKYYADELNDAKKSLSDTMEEEARIINEQLTALNDYTKEISASPVLNLSEETIKELSAAAEAIRKNADSALAELKDSPVVNPNGSHAAGLPYVPYDGYIAELHQGERVLTREQAKQYVYENTPKNFDIPVARNVNLDAAAAVVNAVSGLASSVHTGSAGSGDLNFVVQIDAVDFYRRTIHDFRRVNNESPEAKGDF